MLYQVHITIAGVDLQA